MGPDEPIAERPKKIPSFPTGVKFSKIVCGGLHTLALTNEGQIFSWGCNDDGALGRTGTESLPGLVDGLKLAMSDIAAGDSHSVAYNKDLGVIYLWGLYRNTRHGNFMDSIKVPQPVGEFEFRRKKIQKVVCGAHHTLFLVDGHVSAAGDPENHNLGRLVLDRHKRDKKGIRIERVDHDRQKCVDVFAGSYHSFAIKADGKLYAWGLNNYGQLGTGDYESSRIMREVPGIDGKNVKMVVGGESHSAALMNNGEVYSWGRNDEGQLGYKLEEPAKEPAPEAPKAPEVPKIAAAAAAPVVETKPSEPAKEESKAAPAVAPAAPVVAAPSQEEAKMKVDSTTPAAKTPEELAAQLGDQSTVPKNCSPSPKKIPTLANIVKISAGTNFTYALAQDSSVFSWYSFLSGLWKNTSKLIGEWEKTRYFAMQKTKMKRSLTKSPRRDSEMKQSLM